MVLLGGAPISVLVTSYPGENLWWWYAYASAFGSLPQSAETAHAAAVTPDAQETVEAAAETVEAAAETARALETVEAAAN